MFFPIFFFPTYQTQGFILAFLIDLIYKNTQLIIERASFFLQHLDGSCHNIWD